MKCEWCENEMEPHPYGMPKKYCSETCRKRAEKKRYYEKHHVSKLRLEIDRPVVESVPSFIERAGEVIQWFSKPRKGFTEEQRKQHAEHSRQIRASQSYVGERERREKSDPLFRVKEKARIKLRKAIIKGIIEKPEKCERCGDNSKLHGHHYRGYDHPLAVIWLCPRCHGEAHIMNRDRKL